MAKVHRLISGVLRLSAAAAAGAAAVLMVTSHEITSLFGFELEAKYSDMPPFIFFVVACAVACAYSGLLAVAPAGWAAAARPVAVMADVVVGMALTGAVAAAGAVAEVGRNGNSHAGWLPICGQVHGYCNRVMAALIAGFGALLVHFAVVMYELHVVADPTCPCH